MIATRTEQSCAETRDYQTGKIMFGSQADIRR
jgi:hypothetical protein